MATASSQVHSQLLLLLLAAAAAAETLSPRPDCPHKCGDINIPFPFGIGPGCFRDRFEMLCNHSFVPPRAFLADIPADIATIEGWGQDYFVDDASGQGMSGATQYYPSPLELLSISVATGEARAYTPVSYFCSTNYTASFYMAQLMRLDGTPFTVPPTRNALIGVGKSAIAELLFKSSEMSRSSLPGCVTYEHGGKHDGPCEATGGCCEVTLAIPAGGTLAWDAKYLGWEPLELPNRAIVSNGDWFDRPCSYAMLVEKSSYNYSIMDQYNKTLLDRLPRGAPVALDFAVTFPDTWNTSCPGEGQPPPTDYACVSDNSYCANGTYSWSYVCKCYDGYDGNPYLRDGCQDIDECELSQVYRCLNGICKNRVGGYDCPCKFGMKGDAKEGTCTDIFPLAAKATVGLIGAILLMVILLFIVILQKEKKKTKEFYQKNGGPTLEKANVIKLFKKGDLKPILKNSNLIGKGCFGEVYKGLLDNKLVAIKKPINGSVLESDQFANEVIIQSQVIHRNIVRLIGCCLEVDAPMLVYEFISQGSLHDILHNNNNKKVVLSLDTRVSIAAHSADGLAYMHSKAHTRILHGDVKPANILLDDNFEPKLSDFGISRLLARDKEHTRSVIGDMNYMDPVYLQEGLLTEKSDVYSFGVVILELISGRRAIHSENYSLVKSFLEAHKKQKKMTELFDKEIATPKDLELLDSLAGMALECLSLDVDQRPSMMDVAERLLILSRSRRV